MPLQIWSYESAELARKRAADRFSRKAEQTLDPTPTPPWTPPPTLEDETRPPVGPKAAASFRDRADQQLQAWQVAMARGGRMTESDLTASPLPTPSAAPWQSALAGLGQAISPENIRARIGPSKEPAGAVPYSPGAEPVAQPEPGAVDEAMARYQQDIGDPVLGSYLEGAKVWLGASPLTRGLVDKPTAPPRSLEEADRYRQQLGEEWRQAPEPFPGAKGVAEMISPLDPLNMIPLGQGARAGAKAVGKGVRAVGEELAVQALEAGPGIVQKKGVAGAAANTATDVKQAFGELGGGMGRSIREADLKAAEEKMAKLKEKYPQATDEWIAAQPLAKQIQRYKDELAKLPGATAGAATGTTAPPAAPTQTATASTPPEPPRTAVGGATLPEPTGPLPERAGNILLEKYQNTEVGEALADAYKAQPEVMEQARRNTIPDTEVKQKAAEVESMIGARAGGWKAGQAWNAETILAARYALEKQQKQVLVLQEAIRGGNNSDITVARFAAELERADALQRVVSGITAEAGRALRQFRQPIPATTDAEALARILRRYGGKTRVEDMAKALAGIDLDNPIAVAHFIRNATKPTMGDKILALRYALMLSSPHTHLINSLTNTVNTLSAPLERGIAATVEVPLAAVQRRPRERFFGEVGAEAVGQMRGIKDGVRKALFVMREGFSEEELVRQEFRHAQAFSGSLGAIIDLPTRGLAASDAFYRTVNFTGALNTEAYRLASKEGLKGQAHTARMAELLANPTPDMLEKATKWSEYRVFQQKPGKTTASLLRAREETHVAGVPVLKVLIPFINTPVNLVKYGLERSPLGIANPDLVRAVRNKDAAGADMLGRWAMGSGIAAAIAAYAIDGKITGAAPTKEGERDAFYRQGKQPFSILIGDQWVSYQRLEPFNQTFAQVAALAIIMEKGEQPPLDAAAQVALTIGKNLVSQSYVTGVSDALNAMEEPTRYGGRWLERMATSFTVPAVARLAERAMDPTTREPKGLVEALKAGVPGLSSDVPARIDVMGQEVKDESPIWSPVKITSAKDDPLETELARLKVAPGKVGDTLGGKKLTREQQLRYQQEAGQTSQAGLQALLDSAYYKGLDDVSKEKALRSITNRMRDMAAENTRQGHTTATADLVQQGQTYATAWAEYNALPKYRNLGAQEAQQADAALTKIRALAKDKNVPQDRALAMYRQTDAAGAQAAQRALNLGANPARKAYLRQHPELTRLLEPVD